MTDDELIKQAQALNSAGIKGRIGIKGELVYRDKDGNVIQTTQIEGSIPLDRFGEQTDDR